MPEYISDVNSTRTKGLCAERCASSYLRAKGYAIVARNYRHARGEIDLVARTSRHLVFVEVRARRSARYGYPEDTISETKRDKIIHTAQSYIETQKWRGDIRFDVVAVDGRARCTHLLDAFY